MVVQEAQDPVDRDLVLEGPAQNLKSSSTHQSKPPQFALRWLSNKLNWVRVQARSRELEGRNRRPLGWLDNCSEIQKWRNENTTRCRQNSVVGRRTILQKNLETILRTSAITRIQRKVKHIDFNAAVEISDALYARLTYGKTHATLQIHLYWRGRRKKTNIPQCVVFVIAYTTHWGTTKDYKDYHHTYFQSSTKFPKSRSEEGNLWNFGMFVKLFARGYLRLLLKDI